MQYVIQAFTHDWATTIIGIILILIIVKFFWELTEWFINKTGLTTSRQRKIKALNESIERHEQNLKDIQQLMQATIVTQTNGNEDMRKALIALLKDRLYQGCNHFIQLGEIPIHEMENLADLYTTYTALGGNGIGTEIWNRAKQLPVKNVGIGEK